MLQAGLFQKGLHLCWQRLRVGWLPQQVCRRWKLLQVCLLMVVARHSGCWTLLRSFLLSWACWLPPPLPIRASRAPPGGPLYLCQLTPVTQVSPPLQLLLLARRTAPALLCILGC